MPRVQLPATTPKRRAWNKGRIIGQKRPLLPKQVWAIRARPELAGNLRAVQLLLGHTKVDSTVRYLGVELEDALSIAERIDI
ncbi:MAG: integrase [Pseudomonadota bacterium]